MKVSTVRFEKGNIVEPQARSEAELRSEVSMMNRPYESSREHLLAHLLRLDVQIRSFVARIRTARQTEADFKGLYISESEIDDLLQQRTGVPPWWHDSGTSQTADMQMAVERLTKEIDARASLSKSEQIGLRLNKLCESFSLTPFDRDALLLAVAPELDIRYERLYAYLQDDVTRKKPSVDLILNLLCSNVTEKFETRARFSRSAPLLRFHLLSLGEDPGYPHPPLLSKYVQVDGRILNYLLELDDLDAQLLPYAQLTAPRAHMADLCISSDIKQRLMTLACWASDRRQVGGRRMQEVSSTWSAGGRSAEPRARGPEV